MQTRTSANDINRLGIVCARYCGIGKVIFKRIVMLTDTRHKTSKGVVTYSKEQKALDIAALVLKGFTKSEAETLVKARYK